MSQARSNKKQRMKKPKMSALEFETEVQIFSGGYAQPAVAREKGGKASSKRKERENPHT